MGLEEAKAEAERLRLAAHSALDIFGDSADMLRELAVYIIKRDH